jgi:acyl-CoA dehydrogenase
MDARSGSPTAEPDVSAILLEQADRLFREAATPEILAAADRGAWPASLWRPIEEAGFPLALVPEEVGGVGLTMRDGLRLVRRAAWATLPVPLAETMVAASLWAEAGGEVPEGTLSLAPVVHTDAILAERAADGGWLLDGRAHRVPWGGSAGHLLLHARDGAGTPFLALVPRGTVGVKVEERRNLANEPRDRLSFRRVAVAAAAVRPAPAAWRDGFLAVGALMRAQQMVGAMERVLDHALRYASERRQFGRPLARFQAIQQMLADAAGHYAAAAAAADLALDGAGTGGMGAPDVFAVAVAKSRAGEAAGAVAEIAHQVHGAMGFTQEHPLHHATRRLWSWRDEFGSESHWQAGIGRLVCADGGAALWPRLAGA